ncbi:MAG: 2-C-methyl-D-erythritol 4-phosphate cytidylyltransferase [Acidimicrobiia bacterium]|nr:2-C-methyl-D-erythritol 4-phosphate cytidylyltransferase [Acidimicrobiia bacterium]
MTPPASEGVVWTIVVAGGSGRRFGTARPKQYLELSGHRVLDWSLAAARSVSDGVVLVVPPERVADTEDAADAVVAGGSTRAASVRAGLAAVPSGTGIIVVHDAARPLAPPALFTSVVDAVRAGADGAVPGLPVSDTIKRVERGRVIETLERRELVAVQTPQAFRGDVLRRAHSEGGDATDDAALVELAGGSVVVVLGDPANTKVTHPGDLEALETMLGDGPSPR